MVMNARHLDLMRRGGTGKLDAFGVENLYFQQELDHFDIQEQRTWKQRYFVNDSLYKPNVGGPIFFMIGGEGSISGGYVTNDRGLIYIKWAEEVGAILVALEHRFYGASQPFVDNISTSNLRYLTSHQALADAATFITSFRQKYPKSGPVISFGGSYPGALAAWFRLKYPHLTAGAIASSGPVLAVLDMISYLDVVEDALDKIGGEECDDNVRAATEILQNLLKTTQGQRQVRDQFHLCSTPNNWKDTANFISDVVGNFMGTVQYNGEIPNQPSVKDLCTIMANASIGTPLDRYAAVTALFYDNSSCLDIKYSTMVTQLLDSKVDPNGRGVGMRQWTYQTCAEFGYFQTTDSTKQPFGNLIPLRFYTEICRDVFNLTVTPRINETNYHYGGKAPVGSNVCFVNGSVDPWHSLSIISSTNNLLPAVYINGTAHCQDMTPAGPRDPPALKPAQDLIGSYLRTYINEGRVK